MGDTLFDLLFGASDPTRPFLILPDPAGAETVVTRGEMAARARAMAGVFADCGLRQGARLLAQVEKSPDAVALYAACLHAGVVFIPLSPTAPIEDTVQCLTETGADLAVVTPDKLARLRQMTAQSGLRVESLSHDGAGSFADLLRAHEDAEPPPQAPVSAGDPALILYTAGSGGTRRGVILSQGALAANARSLIAHWAMGDHDTLCHALPLSHAHGLAVAFNTAAAAGAALAFLPRYDPELLAAGLARSTMLMGVPSFYARLCAQRDFPPARLRAMRLFISGGAPLDAETHAAFARLSGHEIIDRYATTETGVLAGAAAGAPAPHGLIGPPLPEVALRICSEDGAPLPAGETGLIEVQSPALFSGYLGERVDPRGDTPRAGFNGDWFMTGDLGRLTATGALELVGPAQDLILAGGFSVDPAEVEAALGAQDGVAESAVIGLPHPDWGETVVAIVVAAQQPAPDPEDLLANLGHGLARFKLPRHVAFVESLPRNALGRIQKSTLRKQFADLLQQG